MALTDMFKDVFANSVINQSEALASSLAEKYKTDVSTLETKVKEECDYFVRNAKKDLEEITYLKVDIKAGDILAQSKIATEKETKVNLVFDDSDNFDYAKRFSSVDYQGYEDDARDIAFMRIVKNVPPYNDIIFPNIDKQVSQQNIQQGMGRSKFRQFILSGISHPNQERMQIVENSDTFQVLFYGKKPEILQINGILKNTKYNPWSTNMLFLWDELMRGTKLAEKGWIFQLYVDGELFTGYPFSFNRGKNAGTDFVVPFSFALVVVNRLNLYQINKYNEFFDTGMDIGKEMQGIQTLDETYNISSVQAVQSVPVSFRATYNPDGEL